MKQFSLKVVGNQNRKTSTDLKIKKSMQQTSVLTKMNNSFKFKQTKLSPIIGQITIIPIKHQFAIIKQMLLGNQIVKLPNTLQRKFNLQQKKKEQNQKQIQAEKKDQQNQKIDFLQNKKKYFKNNKNRFNTMTFEQQKNIEDKIQQQLIKSHKQFKCQKKTKALPKLQNQGKNLPLKKNRPLLTSIDQNLKNISSLHFYILQHSQKIPIIAQRCKTKIQVASLTKIMTFYTVYKICIQYNVNIQHTEIKIQQKMIDVAGTSAGLEHNQIYSIQQLLYGMMLPSGNDASIALATWCGRALKSKNAQNQNQMKLFVERMNIEAKQLKMQNSTFGNCHGLPHKNNRTTCQDIAKLCSECLQIKLFKQIVSTKLYKFRVFDPQIKRKIALQWQNTNKLLRRPGFLGIKTGITVTAGPCLASAYQFFGKIYIVIIAKCCKLSRRFKQTRKLLVHCLERIDYGRPLQKSQIAILKKLNKNNEDIDSDYSDEQTQFNFTSFSQQQIQKRTKTLTQI